MANSKTHAEPIKVNKKEGNTFLEIRTGGERGVISTHASVSVINQHDGHASKSFMPFSDFSVYVSKTAVSRVTNKRIDEVHKVAMDSIDSIRAQAIEHYAAEKHL